MHALYMTNTTTIRASTGKCWTVKNATECAALYGAQAAEYEREASTLVYAPEWLAQFERSAEANRREERYCLGVLEVLTR